MPALVREGKPQVAHQPRVLIVDDEPDVIELMRDLVVKHVDCRVMTASTLKEARQLISRDPVEVLVIDLHLPDGDGMSLLAALRESLPNSSAVVMTGQPSVDTAIGAL